MREGFFITQLEQIKNTLAAVVQSFRAAMTAEGIQNEALKRLLLEKGVITETEFSQTVSKIIEDANKQAAEPKQELTKPTEGDVAAVDASKTV